MTGPTSTRSDRARAIRRLSGRSFRDRVGSFLVEGPASVTELVTWSPDTVDEVLVSVEAGQPAALAARRAAEAGVRITEVPEALLLAVTETVTPSGIAAVSRFVDVPATDLAAGQHRLSVLLHDVRDPGNAGTVLRTADAAGAAAVHFSAGSVDPYNGKCVRSAVGSLFHVALSRSADSAGVIRAARAAGSTILATTVDGELELGTPAATAVLSHPTLWILGNEAHGLPPDICALADHRVRIPILGRADSLNMAAAAAVALYASALADPPA